MNAKSALIITAAASLPFSSAHAGQPFFGPDAKPVKEAPATNSKPRILFNLPANCNRIKKKSWRSCGRIIVLSNGTMHSTIKTSSNRWEGFTGAVKITFMDEKGEPIFEVLTPSYGVNGESERRDQWTAQVPEWVVEYSSRAKVHGIHTPTNRTRDWTIKSILQAGKAYADVATGGLTAPVDLKGYKF